MTLFELVSFSMSCISAGVVSIYFISKFVNWLVVKLKLSKQHKQKLKEEKLYKLYQDLEKVYGKK